jgi:putative ABC transport system ATP-binding protein
VFENGRKRATCSTRNRKPQLATRNLSMISLQNIEKCYKLKGGFYYVLQQITFRIEQGEFVSIMGPSGAGKSTLLHILGLHDANWEGEYHLLGQKVHTLPPKERLALQKKHTGFVFQSYHLLDDLTVYENIELPLAYRDVPKKEREAIVCDALDRFNIVGKRDLFPAQLSGGQQQLVGVVRATVAKPELLLADEPTGNLHSDQAKEIMELFCKLNAAGTTIIQVTHSETNAGYGKRIIRLKDGWLEPHPRQRLG